MSAINLLFLAVLLFTTAAMMFLDKGDGSSLIALNQEIKWGVLLLVGGPPLALLAIRQWWRREGWSPPSWLGWAIAALVAAWLLSSLAALDPQHSFFEGVRLYLVPLGLLLLAAASRPDSRRIAALFGGLALVGLLFALVGLAQHFQWSDRLAGLPRVGVGSLLYSRNFAGEWLVLLLPATVAFGLLIRPGWLRRFYALVPLSMLAHLVLSEGRAAWVALLVGFTAAGGFALYLRWREGGGWRSPGAGPAFLAVPVAFLLLIAASPYWTEGQWWRAPLAFEAADGRYLEELGSIRADRSSGRLELWRDSLELLRNEAGVVGAGVEHYRLLYPRYMDDSRFLFRLYWEKRRFNTAKYAHNDYIQLVADLGLMGLLAVVSIGVGALVVAGRAAARGGEPAERLVMIALAATVVIHAVVMVFDFPSRIAPHVMVVWFIMGLALSRGGSGAAAGGGRLVPMAAAALFLAGTLVGGALLWGEYFAARGEIEVRAGRFDRAAEAYGEALRVAPWDERFLTKASWMASRRGRCDEAIALMERGERRNPYLLPVLLNGLNTCRGRDQNGVIRSALGVLITYYPDIPETRRWVRRLGGNRD